MLQIRVEVGDKAVQGCAKKIIFFNNPTIQ